MKKTVVYITTLFLLANGICFAGNIKKENKTMTNKKIVQTAGRNSLGTFAPEFAHFNDDVLFGENWNNKDLTLKTRSLITVIRNGYMNKLRKKGLGKQMNKTEYFLIWQICGKKFSK